MTRLLCFIFQDCLNVTNEGCKFKKDIYELNPDHTHFIMVETETPDDKEKVQYVEFRFNFERQLQCQLGRPRRYKRLLSFGMLVWYTIYCCIKLCHSDIWHLTWPLFGKIQQLSKKLSDTIVNFRQLKEGSSWGKAKVVINSSNNFQNITFSRKLCIFWSCAILLLYIVHGWIIFADFQNGYTWINFQQNSQWRVTISCNHLV